jgi:hypothetical protein
MDSEIKAKWVAALRSGQYPQTRSHLRDDYGYCVYGVLCDLKNPEGWHGVVDDEEANTRYFIDGDERNYEDLPETVQQWAGIAEDDLVIHTVNYGTVRVFELNDYHAVPFNTLADLIEAQL